MFVLPCETFVQLLALSRWQCHACVPLSTAGGTGRDSISMFCLRSCCVNLLAFTTFSFAATQRTGFLPVEK